MAEFFMKVNAKEKVDYPEKLDLTMEFFNDADMKKQVNTQLFEKLGLKTEEAVQTVVKKGAIEEDQSSMIIPKVGSRFYRNGQMLSENTLLYIVTDVSETDPVIITYKEFLKIGVQLSDAEKASVEVSLTDFNNTFTILTEEQINILTGGKRKSRRRIPHKKFKRGGKSRHLRKFGGNPSKMH